MTLLTDREYLESKQFPFSIRLYPFTADEAFELHSHEFIEFVYVLGGRGVHTYQGSVHPLSAGDVFIIEPHAEHGYESERDNPLLVYNVLFQPSVLAAELELLSKVNAFVDFFYLEPFNRKYANFSSQLNLKYEEQAEMSLRLERMLKEFSAKRSGYQLVIKTILLDMLIMLSRTWDERDRRANLTLEDADETMVQVCRYIEQHHARAIPLKEVSQLCGMSQSSFSTKFKQKTGKTFIEYRNSARLRMAARLMLDSKEKVFLIAQQVGFDDLSFFNKLFKQEFGMSPKQYRNR
ncbi:AraC family transcriptional regulator [Paenibacillus koleovorans]|uniref:AraC family transcriptional regulator n=1 Tax=Paenibacillus koleovorans TaxID=121608 RepID=UPI000FDAC8BB|nr:AraC family transcriptional regulator [Paenibacillus koleovorans]